MSEIVSSTGSTGQKREAKASVVSAPKVRRPFNLSGMADALGLEIAQKIGRGCIDGEQAVAQMLAEDVARVREPDKKGKVNEKLVHQYNKLLIGILKGRQGLDIDAAMAGMSAEDRHAILLAAAVDEFRQSIEFRESLITMVSQECPEIFEPAVQARVQSMAMDAVLQNREVLTISAGGGE